ncbi:MAG: hypothetical protein LBK82_05360 [Planctomycetaceae bacterium]|nr:hypothetical protein [Planctomycetaceae bacterium]
MGYLSKSPLGGCAGWFALTPTRKATPFAIVNLVHSRLLPTQPFSERSPTYKRLPT